MADGHDFCALLLVVALLRFLMLCEIVVALEGLIAELQGVRWSDNVNEWNNTLYRQTASMQCALTQAVVSGYST